MWEYLYRESESDHHLDHKTEEGARLLCSCHSLIGRRDQLILLRKSLGRSLEAPIRVAESDIWTKPLWIQLQFSGCQIQRQVILLK